ncbi:hypothetical protein MRS44_018871 [Fusarium solani]|uniref:uncharacterized protein n=1 Tax=Fusarium solani TaxID=169388 RepID=UPI0032C42406|nr:hypothetical protein MRS44_018871 [Fusarium solani]
MSANQPGQQQLEDRLFRHFRGWTWSETGRLFTIWRLFWLRKQGWTGSYGNIWDVVLGYELLLNTLEEYKQLAADFPDPEHFRIGINLAWDKLDEYYQRLDETPIYYTAMALHPAYRWDWFDETWAHKPSWVEKAKEMVADVWLSDYAHLEVRTSNSRGDDEPPAKKTSVFQPLREEQSPAELKTSLRSNYCISPTLRGGASATMVRRVYTEDDVAEAIFDVTDRDLSQTQAAQKRGVPRSTLSRRLSGQARRNERIQAHQRISKSQEETLIRWVLRQESLGYALSHSQLCACVEAILQQQGDNKPLGKHWTTRFVKRHPQLSTKLGKRQKAARFDGFTPKAVTSYFDIRETEFGWIKPKNTVNVDEGGIMAGFALTQRKALLKGVQSRTWTSFIEAITATGRALKPGIIFKGKELQKQWFLNEFELIADWHYITSPNGWTDNHMALEWLKDVYLPQTEPRDASDARLIILDGHGSHAQHIVLMAYNQIQPDKEKVVERFKTPSPPQLHSENTPKTSRQARDLAKHRCRPTRRKYSKITKGLEALEMKVAVQNARITGLEEQVSQLRRGKKRKAVPNPNRRFMALAEALAAKKALPNSKEAEIEVDVDEDVESVIEVGVRSEDESEDFMVVTKRCQRTRSGREVKKPRRE